MAQHEHTSGYKLSDYITLDEAAKILTLSQDRIAQLCETGELEGLHLAGRWLVKRAAAYAYLKGE